MIIYQQRGKIIMSSEKAIHWITKKGWKISPTQKHLTLLHKLLQNNKFQLQKMCVTNLLIWHSFSVSYKTCCCCYSKVILHLTRLEYFALVRFVKTLCWAGISKLVKEIHETSSFKIQNHSQPVIANLSLILFRFRMKHHR